MERAQPCDMTTLQKTRHPGMCVNHMRDAITAYLYHRFRPVAKTPQNDHGSQYGITLKIKHFLKYTVFLKKYNIFFPLCPMLAVLMMTDAQIIKVFFDQMNLKHLLTQTP